MILYFKETIFGLLTAVVIFNIQIVEAQEPTIESGELLLPVRGKNGQLVDTKRLNLLAKKYSVNFKTSFSPFIALRQSIKNALTSETESINELKEKIDHEKDDKVRVKLLKVAKKLDISKKFIQSDLSWVEANISFESPINTGIADDVIQTKKRIENEHGTNLTK